MREWQSLAHVKWECKYHVVIVPKYRGKVIFGGIRGEVGEIKNLLSGRAKCTNSLNDQQQYSCHRVETPSFQM